MHPPEGLMEETCIFLLESATSLPSHQPVKFSQIAFWNIKLSTEFYAYLRQPLTLKVKKVRTEYFQWTLYF